MINMASEQSVRQYLAYWFQLGKKVWVQNGKAALLPQTVIHGDRYSDEFESCWQRIIAADSGDCYLDGTSETIDQLLSDRWDIVSCARCEMPVPMSALGAPITHPSCPCSDLASWPNTEIPAPRMPVSSDQHLQRISDRLNL
jgi:hypothetical protein